MFSNLRIPYEVKHTYPNAHWCRRPGLYLVTDNVEDCFCGHVSHKRGACGDCGKIDEERFLIDGRCGECHGIVWELGG